MRSRENCNLHSSSHDLHMTSVTSPYSQCLQVALHIHFFRWSLNINAIFFCFYKSQYEWSRNIHIDNGIFTSCNLQDTHAACLNGHPTLCRTPYVATSLKVSSFIPFDHSNNYWEFSSVNATSLGSFLYCEVSFVTMRQYYKPPSFHYVIE